MTEPEWTTSEQPLNLFRHVRSKVSSRKLQLLACGIARLAWRHLPADVQDGILAAETWVEDGCDLSTYHVIRNRLIALYTEHECESKLNTLEEAVYKLGTSVVTTPLDDAVPKTILSVLPLLRLAMANELIRLDVGTLDRQVADRIREVVGNPFRERGVVPSWMAAGGGAIPAWITRVSETARAVALGIHSDQAFERLPILADALEDGGCIDDELLAHLRDPSAHHLRGCWALDLVLGK